MFKAMTSRLGWGVKPAALHSKTFDTSDADVDDQQKDEQKENVVVCIVGAGAAGLTAAYTLQRKGIQHITVLEASSRIGGRVKKMDPPIADFPIDVGGEWIHVHKRVLNKITGERDTASKIPTVVHNANPYYEWTGTRFTKIREPMKESKFVNYTWFDFLNDYIVPTIRDRIMLCSPVAEINYESSSKIHVKLAQSDDVVVCDYAIVAVPLPILKDGDITFEPPLPQSKTQAFSDAVMPTAIKVFMEFTETFYPLSFGLYKYDYSEESDHFYYDATYGQRTEKHILAMFAFGEPVEDYVSQGGDDEIQAYILKELDSMFEGKASKSFVRMSIQDWSKEPYIRGAYSELYDNMSLMRVLSSPVEQRIFFAGEAMPADGASYGYVHGAALSGQKAANAISQEIARRRSHAK